MIVREIFLELTGYCQLGCLRCLRNYEHCKHLITPHNRPLNEIIAQLDTYVHLSKLTLIGMISEPTLYPEFLSFIEYAKKRNLQLDIATNGETNIDWGKVAKILDNKRDSISLTICGTTQELHERYRKGSLLENVLATAKTLKSNGFEPLIGYIRFDYNAHDVPNLENFLKGYRYIVYDCEGERLIKKFIEPVPEDIKAIEYVDKAYKYIKAIRKHPIEKDSKIKCRWLEKGKIYIDQFGRTTACNMLAEHDIWTHNYKDILHYRYPVCYRCEQNTLALLKSYKIPLIC